jgi:hypothetical protein
MKSKLGLALAGLYVLIAAYFILTQGLFGESFIALILGLPWVLLLTIIEFGGTESVVVMVILTLLPMAINVALLYWIGSLIGRASARKDATIQ